MNTINFDFRREILERKTRIGTFLNTGSPIAVELAAQSGLDWILIDLEHGMGDWDRLPSLLMAATGRGAVPVVRIPQLRQELFKRAFDMGALGVMVPYIETAEQAADAVRFSRYPPRGVRGVAKFNRAAKFGACFEEWLARSHEATLVIAQIETATGLKNVDAIAAVEGIDVLFVGPLDLSVSLGIPQQYNHPDFLAAKARVVDAATKAGKAAGILGLDPEQTSNLAAEGFNFLAVGSDGGYLSQAFAKLVERGRKVRG
ncbi:MAG: aldolase/citrate lyase family protein [Opitutaceae bacterium]